MIPLRNQIGITYHNTSNTNPSATDEMHAIWLQNLENADNKYVSAHIFVDEDSITQVIPLTEETYHAGDGKKGVGNSETISIEICENKNYKKAERNAQLLGASMLLQNPNWDIFKHEDWSGKNCPRVILNNNRWNAFKNEILEIFEQSKVVNWKLRGLKYLSDEFNVDYDYWVERINEPAPVWAMMEIIARVTRKLIKGD
ncbi:MAG: peptidoglycan recognition protein family protein [Bacillota bacterium]